MSTDTLRWRDRVTIAQHELTVVAILVAELLDRRSPLEADFQRLTLSLHRLQALSRLPS